MKDKVYNEMLIITQNARLSQFRTTDMVEFTFCNTGTNPITINGILLTPPAARGINSNSTLVNFVSVAKGEKDITEYTILFTGGLINELYVFCKCIVDDTK